MTNQKTVSALGGYNMDDTTGDVNKENTPGDGKEDNSKDDGKYQTLKAQLFDNHLNRLWRTGALMKLYTSDEDCDTFEVC